MRTQRTPLTALAVATAFTVAGSVGAGETSTAKTAKTDARSTARDALPAQCESMAYVDVAAIAKSAPVQKNDEAIRDGVRDLINTMPGTMAGKTGEERWAGAANAAKSTLSKLDQQGLSWKDVSEVGACATKGGQQLVTIAGKWQGGDLVDKLVKAGSDGALKGNVSPLKQGGRSYAAITAEGKKFYAYEVSPGVLGIASDLATFAQAKGKAGSELALFKTKLDDGRTVTTTLDALPNAQSLTTVFLKKGAFQPSKDSLAYQTRAHEWAERVAETPLAPMAGAIRASKVSVTSDQVRIRTVVPNEAVNDALANATNASRDDWAALMRGVDRGDVPSAIGGGPGEGKSEKKQNQNQKK